MEELVRSRLDTLPDGLRSHIRRVEQVAGELARQHNVDKDKVALGALAHDIARAMKAEQLLQEARELGISVNALEERLPVLLHGPVAAESLKRLAGLADQDVYDAVFWHSTAHECLGPTGKVVFLADKLDPQKVGRYPFLPQLRDLAMRDLDGAILDFLTRQLGSLLQNGDLVHPASVKARNALLLR